MAPENDAPTIDPVVEVQAPGNHDAPTIDPDAEAQTSSGSAEDELDRRIGEKFTEFAPLLADLVQKKQQESESAMRDEIRSLFTELPGREAIAEMIDQAVEKKAGSLLEQYGMAASRNGNGAHSGVPAAEGGQPQNGNGGSERSERLAMIKQISDMFQAPRVNAQQQGTSLSTRGIDEVKSVIEAVNGLRSALIEPELQAQETAYMRLRREFELDARLGRDPNERLSKSGEAS